jgi:hypothetical protein
MKLYKKKQKKFEYGLLSKLGLSLAVELWNGNAYQTEKPKMQGSSQSIALYLKNLQENETTSISPSYIISEPRYGLQNSPATKLIIIKDFKNQYGFTLEVGAYETSTLEIEQNNLKAKARIENAWKNYGLPFKG